MAEPIETQFSYDETKEEETDIRKLYNSSFI